MLVMHGGMGLDHTYLRPWLDPLGEQVELIFYDHRGNGRSAAPEDWGDVDHATWVADADALRAHLGHERIFLFGHSHGAYLALEYALRYPDRLQGLVLCSATPAVDYPEVMMANAQARATPEQFAALAGGLSEPVPDDETLRRMWLHLLPLYFHGDVPEAAEAQFAGVHYRADAFNCGFFQCLPRFNLVGQMAQLSAPTLILAGADDFITPVAQGAERLHNELPNSKLVVLERSGHYPFIEEPAAFVAAIRDWLEQTLP